MPPRESSWIAAAGAMERARRARLMGEAGPWFQPVAARLLRRLDPEEKAPGIAACRAVLEQAEAIDESLRAFDRTRVPWSGEALLAPAEVLATLIDEPERSSRAELATLLARSAAPGSAGLADVFASVADRAAEDGAIALVGQAEIAGADRLLRLSRDATEDVLGWARHGMDGPFAMRATTNGWQDVLRVLANPRAKKWLPSDPWRPLTEWRASWGIGGDGADARAEFELSLGQAAGIGSWAVPRAGRAAVGAAGWTAALRWRFCLEALGSWDVLREAGVGALLPLDGGAAALWRALYPLLLTDGVFLQRVARAQQDADGVRWLALSELLWARIRAAAVRVQAAFQEERTVARAREAAAQEFAQALFADVPPDLGLMLCRPFARSTSAPALFAAAALLARQQETFDTDWWRNPRAVAPARELMARGATETLEKLVPEMKDDAPLAAWIDATLGA